MKAPLREPYNQFFGTLSNQTRLDIIEVLFNGPKNVSEISHLTKMKQPTISHNLQILELHGFVKVTPKGKERIYELNKSTIKPLINLMHHHIDKYCSKLVSKKHHHSH